MTDSISFRTEGRNLLNPPSGGNRQFNIPLSVLKKAKSQCIGMANKGKNGIVLDNFGVFLATFGVLWDKVGVVWDKVGNTNTPKNRVKAIKNTEITIFSHRIS